MATIAISPFDVVDVERFIAEVKHYPEIWNPNSESHTDRVKKRSAWTNICRELCDGFDEKEDREKYEINNAMAKKWRNIKDTYLKTLKKPKCGLICNKGRQYVYAKQLSFLREQSGLVTETNSSLNYEKLVSDEDSVELRLATNCDQNDQPDNSSFNKTRKRKHDLEPCVYTNASIPSCSATSTVQLLQSNPNQSFFQSLVPIVNGFTEEETIDFRMEVLCVIKKIQKARQNSAENN